MKRTETQIAMDIGMAWSELNNAAEILQHAKYRVHAMDKKTLKKIEQAQSLLREARSTLVAN